MPSPGTGGKNGSPHLGEAESVFQKLWEEIRAQDLQDELALLSIDLAEALREKRRSQPSRRRVLPILESWGLHYYALAARMFTLRDYAQFRLHCWKEE